MIDTAAYGCRGRYGGGWAGIRQVAELLECLNRERYCVGGRINGRNGQQRVTTLTGAHAEETADTEIEVLERIRGKPARCILAGGAGSRVDGDNSRSVDPCQVRVQRPEVSATSVSAG